MKAEKNVTAKWIIAERGSLSNGVPNVERDVKRKRGVWEGGTRSRL